MDQTCIINHWSLALSDDSHQLVDPNRALITIPWNFTRQQLVHHHAERKDVRLEAVIMSNDFWCHPQRSALSSRVVVSLSNVWNFVIILDGRWFRLVLASCRHTHLHLAELKVFLVVRGSNVRDSEPEISCVGVWWWETRKEEFVNNEAQRNNKKVKNKKKKILTHQSNIVHFDHRAHSMISNHDE